MEPDWKSSDPWWAIVGCLGMGGSLLLVGWLTTHTFRYLGWGPGW